MDIKLLKHLKQAIQTPVFFLRQQGELYILMGAGSRLLNRAPHKKPPFTVADLKKAVPSHCFKRSLLRSSYHLVHDLFFAGFFYYIACSYFYHLPRSLQYLAWPIYTICQGCVMAGLWIIGHGCGHHAFSDYQWIDDFIGMILHSSLFTPYFSWKISHRRHHANTQSLDHDEVYVPKFKTGLHWFDLHPHGLGLKVLAYLVFGFPMYLLFNVTGRKYERFVNHFDPTCPMFSDGERALVLVSNVGVLTTAYGLYRLVLANGLPWVLGIYGFPLVFMYVCIIIITYLQHTHTALPHYDSTEWGWLRGALCTVDRDFGILNYVFHDVTGTHVAHHLFPTISYHHGKEVTEAIKPVLGEYYQFDGTPILKALWREANDCIYVRSDEDDNKGVYWFDNKF